MKVKIILITLSFIVHCSLFIGHCYAWGKEGHKIVTEIAEKKLKPGVENKVQHYLGTTTFVEAGVWMDEMRSDHAYDYMKPWHYVDFEKGRNYVAAPEGDIVTELQKVINELKNYHNMKDADINTDLKILFHLCEDITQPLHTGYGSDKGGNTISVNYNNKQTNLHRVWDTDIIINEHITTESCMLIASKWTVEQEKSFQNLDVVKWMLDSRSNLNFVYDFKNNTIDQNYVSLNKEIIGNQLYKGALILSSVLNDIFQN